MFGRTYRNAAQGTKLLAFIEHTARSAPSASRRATIYTNQMIIPDVNRSIQKLGRRTHNHFLLGISHFGSIASLNIAGPAEPVLKRLPVQVGASLKIDLSKTEAGINVTCGDNLEEVVLQPKWAQINEYKGGWKSLDITLSNNQVDVKHFQVQSQDGQLLALTEMNAQIPARWCSLDVQAGLGSVYIQNVREGSLSARTNGGGVKLGEIKGSEATINSGGGDVEATVMQAKASIQTVGGKLSVKRLQGSSIALDSGGGNVVLGSLYGDVVRVESRGGLIEAKEIQAEERALVSSNGGSVLINGIDGNVAVVSNGGHIEVQLNEHAEEITIDAGKDGHAVLCLSARLTAQLRYEGAQGVVQEGSILTAGPHFGIYEFKGLQSAVNKQVTSSGWRGSDNYLPGGVTACRIHVSSAAEVHVKQRSWFDLVTSRGT